MTDSAPLRRNRKPTHPGQILREHYLVPRKVTQADFAKDIEISEKHLSRIINGHVRLDSDVAAKISKALHTTTEFWVNLQAKRDAWEGNAKVAAWQPRVVYPAPEYVQTPA
jgi:addiction module HigA family antidote